MKIQQQEIQKTTFHFFRLYNLYFHNVFHGHSIFPLEVLQNRPNIFFYYCTRISILRKVKRLNINYLNLKLNVFFYKLFRPYWLESISLHEYYVIKSKIRNTESETPFIHTNLKSVEKIINIRNLSESILINCLSKNFTFIFTHKKNETLSILSKPLCIGWRSPTSIEWKLSAQSKSICALLFLWHEHNFQLYIPFLQSQQL